MYWVGDAEGVCVFWGVWTEWIKLILGCQRGGVPDSASLLVLA